jgi:hypothetical protein
MPAAPDMPAAPGDIAPGGGVVMPALPDMLEISPTASKALAALDMPAAPE